MKKIVGGVLGGLVGYFAGRLYITIKEVKAEMAREEEYLSVVPAEKKNVVKVAELVQLAPPKVTDWKPAPEDDEEEKTHFPEDDDNPDWAHEHAGGLEDNEDFYLIRELVRQHRNDMAEELEELRHEPNSIQARNQYVAMKLSEVQEGPVYNILYRLFGVAFEPKSQADETVAKHIYEDRASFFGDHSTWNQECTMAELVLHFAYLMSEDHGESIDHYAGDLVTNAGYTDNMSSQALQEVSYNLYTHNQYTAYGFGMFGLRAHNAGYTSPEFLQQYFGCSLFEETDYVN